MNVHRALKTYDPQPYAEWAYVLRHDDLEDGVNKLGMRVKDPVFDTPLCQGCDQPIRNNRCDNCCVVFILETVPGGVRL